MKPRATLLLLGLLVVAAGCVVPGAHPPPTFAHRVLSADPSRLVVEVSYAPGHLPSAAAREHLMDSLANVSKKTTITWSANEEASLVDPGHTWNVTRDLVPAEAATRRTMDATDVVVLRVLYVGGKYERDGVAGVTLAPGGPATIFLDTLRQTSVQSGLPPLPLPQQSVDILERSTLLHESSHAMGLVNDGIPMVKDHEDKQNPGHSSDPKSVMYWKVDSVNALRTMLLNDGSVPDAYDADDLADLQAATR